MPQYSRDPNGRRFLLQGGLNTTMPVDVIPPGGYPYLQNVRRVKEGRITGRPVTGDAIYTYPAPPHTIQRLNSGDGSYVRIIGAAGVMYVNAASVATGLSGNPLSIVSLEPNESVLPWAYVGDSSESVPLVANNPTSLSPASVGSSAEWTAPTNATSTSVYASYSGGVLNALTLTVSGLSIPSNATIFGIGISFKSYVSAVGSIVVAPNFVGALASSLTLTTTPTPYVFGGQSDKWGAALTPALLNAGFSFGFTAGGGGSTYFLNSFVITIYYSVPTTVTATGMLKVRSDGLLRKTGVMEPQSAPLVGLNTLNSTVNLTLPATTPPWTNIGGVNPNYNYSGTDTQPPYPAIILTPISGATVALTVSGTATVNGGVHAPGDAGPTTAGHPGAFIASAETVVYAFTDANGNILAQSTAVGATPVVGNVGATTTLTVPTGAAQLQIGVNSQGGSYAANSGSFLVQAVLSTSAIAQAAALVGNVTAYVWGDSPHSGPVATYIWRNPNDSGTGTARTIGTAQVVSSNNSLILDSTPEDGTVPVQWSTLKSDGSTIGSINLFDPALESDGYQDFNACLVGSIFFPAGGTYNVQIKNKDQVMFGMGGGVTSPNQPAYGTLGQTTTVVSALPLLFVSAVNGAGGQQTNSFTVNVPEMGVYQFEFDWDYWYHTGRSLIVQIGPTPGAAVATLPPLPQGVRTNVQYWIKYRASETGAQSNPSPGSLIEVTPVLANTITAPYSHDPQVDKYDLYRQDDGLANPTYVATGPNDGLGGTINGILYNTPITDTLNDIAGQNNPLMQRDDFEPFPSIDSPKSGMVTIVGGVITWKSGDQFNTRWLPGTQMLIGSPTQQAYTLVARPTSATTIVIPDIPDTIGDVAGDGVPYNIAQPILAQQPMPSMWGPDAYGFVHACGDTNQPGAYKWTKAYNPDSAPDTNTLLLTSPSEPLMGGSLINGVSLVFSNLHAWLMYPNFADAQATTIGIQGNQWNPILATGTRGLYIRNCLCSIGGKLVAFRASDGIYMTPGAGDKSITGNIYNLFPHENSTPSAVQIGPFTVYPPDDTRPQKLAYQNGYLYYDYQDVNGTYRTLVYDEEAQGWSVDLGEHAFSCHAPDSAAGVAETAVGCADNTLRVLETGGTESAVSVVATPSDNAGDTRALKRLSDVFVRALVQASNPITVALYSNQYAASLAGFSPSSLTGAGSLTPYIVDFGTNQPKDVIDLAATFSWSTAAANELDLWQPGFLPLPISILSRVTEALTHGMSGYQHCYLVNMMYYATALVTLTMNMNQGNDGPPVTVTQTWQPGGSLFVPAKVALLMPPNKFKTCAWQLSSSQPFYLFDCEAWVGDWQRTTEYAIVHPFSVNANPESFMWQYSNTRQSQ